MDLKKVNWKEVPDSQQVEFNEPGDVFMGILVDMHPKRDGVNSRYFFENLEGRHLVWGTVILDQRLSQVQIGSPVKIEYKEDKALGQGKTLKIFKVSVPEETEKKAPVTDEGDGCDEEEDGSEPVSRRRTLKVSEQGSEYNADVKDSQAELIIETEEESVVDTTGAEGDRGEEAAEAAKKEGAVSSIDSRG